MGRNIFNQFSVFELLLLAMIAAAGVAVKPVVVSFTHLVTGPLFIPGGSMAGGLYMMFPVLGAAMVHKRGVATIVCTVQAFMVLVTGIYGTHGAASLITYVLPGIMIDLLWLVAGRKGFSMISCFLGGIVSNLSGTILVNIVFFRMPLVPLVFTVVVAAFSGGIGGLIAWNIVRMLQKQHAFTFAQENQGAAERRSGNVEE